MKIIKTIGLLVLMLVMFTSIVWFPYLMGFIWQIFFEIKIGNLYSPIYVVFTVLSAIFIIVVDSVVLEHIFKGEDSLFSKHWWSKLETKIEKEEYREGLWK